MDGSTEHAEPRLNAVVIDPVFLARVRRAAGGLLIETDVWLGPSEDWARRPDSLLVGWFTILLRDGQVLALRTSASM
jgi:hypothetical protein